MKKLSDLEFNLIDTRWPASEHIELCEKAYKLWDSCWKDAFKKLNQSGELRSDDFLDRQMSTFSIDGEPVALFFNNWFDISRDSIVRHSYFKNYPPNVISSLRDLGFKKVMALSYMTVHPEWVSRFTDLPMFDLLFSMGVMKYFENTCDAIIGYIRTDKSFYTSFYRHGAVKIESSMAYSVPVDFCYVTEDKARLSSIDGIAPLAIQFWETINNEDQNAKKAG